MPLPASGDRLVKDCCHQVEPDPTEMAARYCVETPVLDWRERLVCSRGGSGAGRYGGASEMRPQPLNGRPSRPLQ